MSECDSIAGHTLFFLVFLGDTLLDICLPITVSGVGTNFCGSSVLDGLCFTQPSHFSGSLLLYHLTGQIPLIVPVYAAPPQSITSLHTLHTYIRVSKYLATHPSIHFPFFWALSLAPFALTVERPPRLLYSSLQPQQTINFAIVYTLLSLLPLGP